MSKTDDRLAAIEARLDTLEAASQSPAGQHLKASQQALSRFMERIAARTSAEGEAAAETGAAQGD